MTIKFLKKSGHWVVTHYSVAYDTIAYRFTHNLYANCDIYEPAKPVSCIYHVCCL